MSEKRFSRGDDKTMQTVKMTFPTTVWFGMATTDGDFVSRFYYQPVIHTASNTNISLLVISGTWTSQFQLLIASDMQTLPDEHYVSTSAVAINEPGMLIAAVFTRWKGQLEASKYK